MNYFEFYGGDYARDTADLSLAEHGAYLLLLSAYYGTEKPLPAAAASLYRICRAMTAEEQASVDAVAAAFFPICADGLRHNERADAEIIKARGRIDAARENGKKGGRPAKSKPNENPVGSDWLTQPPTHEKAPHAPHAMHPSGEFNHTPPAAPGALEGCFEGHAESRLTPNPVAAYAVAMGKLGFRVTAINPDLVAYFEEGGTIEHLVTVSGWHLGKPASYPIRHARRELAEKAAPITPGVPNGQSQKLSAFDAARAAFDDQLNSGAFDHDALVVG